MKVEAEYLAKLDRKRRIVLRSSDAPLYEQYLVRHRSDGVIELRPQALVDVAALPENVLRTLTRSMENLKQGVASSPIDLDKLYPDLEDDEV